jgi:hypothetical protein
MDLMIRQGPHGLSVRAGSIANWLTPPWDDVVAILPRMGPHADAIADALVRDDSVTRHAPFSTILAVVARVIADGDGEEEDEDADESGSTTEYGTLCSCCRRERETSPPPPPLPADPSAPRLTEDALARHTQATERDRSRSRSPRGRAGQ